MQGLRVTIVRWVDDHQPGWVECHLIDHWDRLWVFIEKAPVVSTEILGPDTAFPCPGVIACELVDHARTLPEADCTILVTTAVPWGVESTTGETRFDVRPEQVVEMDD